MNHLNQKLILYIDKNHHLDWELFLKSKFKILKSNNIEINSSNIDLSCTDIKEIVKLITQHNCKVISFCSTSPKTIVSAQSLGYDTQFSIGSDLKTTTKTNENNLTLSRTQFHQGTVRSGDYLDSHGDLLILGDVNPGAKVSAEGNIIIWGRLLGIAHAGSKGNSHATISALQLRPVQLRIANKVARGPKEKIQLGIAEQAKIASGEIIISPLENT